MTQTLKRCPFCGHEAEIEYEANEIPVKDNWIKVQCVNCGSNSGWYLSEGQAVEAWNRWTK